VLRVKANNADTWRG